MKTLIVSYSLTGNNRTLAEACAARLGADHFVLEETSTQTAMTTVLDMAFGRAPALAALPPSPEAYGLTVFMGPVWMFGVASPFRRCFKALRGRSGKYAFVSLSGGALGANTRISRELARRLGGKNLALVLDLNAVHFCELGSGEGRGEGTADTGAYRLAEHPGDLERLAGFVCSGLGSIRPQTGAAAL